MSTINLLVGQCGNQLGTEVLNQLLKFHDEYLCTALKKNTLLVDSEPKVVERCEHQPTETKTRSKVKKERVEKINGAIPEENIIKGKRGRGCNWALGYNGVGQECILEETTEAMRRCAERCSSLSNIFIVHSMAGGTGGGFGSRLLETLRDEYPLENIVNCCVAPYSTGETTLQNYNQLLTMASLQKFSDAVLLFKNDIVHHNISTRTDKPITLSIINDYISSCVSGVISPTDTLSHNKYFDPELSEIVRTVCPDPQLKFLSATRSIKRDAAISSMLNSTITQLKHDTSNRKCRSLSNLLVVRGSDSQSCLADLSLMEDKVRKELNSVSWSPYPLDIWTARDYYKGSEWSQVTLLSNYSNIIPFCENVWNKSQVMYHSRAFLHWYERHGVDKEYFDEAFTTVKELHQQYYEATVDT